MENMIRIDCHAHTSNVSKCCRIDYKEVIRTAKEHNIDGVILTNHYQKSYLAGTTSDAFIEKYIQEYKDMKAYAEKKDFRVFWGIEVTMELYPRVHMLIYDVTPDFLRQNPEIYDCTQQQLYDLVKRNGGILIQAHPYRHGTSVLDVNYLDGVEINCHPLYKKTHAEELIDIARSNHLLITCGGDYHADTYRPKCGIYVPKQVDNDADLIDYIKNSTETLLCIDEPGTESTYDYKYAH